MCGEGGEYETLTLDCPLFKKRIVVYVLFFQIVNFVSEESHIVVESNDQYSPVGHLIVDKFYLEEKESFLEMKSSNSSSNSLVWVPLMDSQIVSNAEKFDWF